ncbi:MAG TPA: HU family DNA-binding protein [Candidatus Heimdallarchaeota archaeon]|nr:HU family DNA-binding protein [Candidatus Heimdallarchaeota archaeon]
MDKGELIDKQATKAVFRKKDMRRALDTMIGLITNARASNEEVLPIGFGKFGATVHNESKRINPQIQKRITVPKNVVATYMPGKKL